MISSPDKEEQYGKIFDFRIVSAEKLENSNYLEDLTNLLENVSSKIANGNKYYFRESHFIVSPNEPNCSYETFISDFKNTFLHNDSGGIHIIRGRSGIGKTLFFDKGIQLLTRNNKHKGAYIKLGVCFKNIDSKKDISFYEQMIYQKLSKNAIDSIRELGFFDEFELEYSSFCGKRYDTPKEYLFPVVFFSKKIFEKYKNPCIIVFDNIDLSCADTQDNVFKATANVCGEFKKFMEKENCVNEYRVYFAMRPETIFRGGDVKIGKIINFPLPNILEISLESLKETITETAHEFDKVNHMKCEVTYFDVIDKIKKQAKTFSDVADYFNRILAYYLIDLWSRKDIIDRLGENSEFHCDIVNYNVRTFLTFLADTLSNGGFKPLTKEFNEGSYEQRYNVFDYIEMIIRGRWIVHPGNKYIDGEANNGAPIVFNVFDTSLWDKTQNDKIENFMLYIRILQFFSFRREDEKTDYDDLEKTLNDFFKVQFIELATKKLAHVGFLYSFFEGANIANKKNFNEVIVEKGVALHISPKGEFYIRKFIYEFEYIYQMALSSLMPISHTQYLKQNKNYKYEKEYTVLCFLNGIFSILKANTASYAEANLIDNFKDTFRQEDSNSRPYSKMLNRFTSVIDKKILSAEDNQTRKAEKLKEILDEGKELQRKSQEYFTSMLGE